MDSITPLAIIKEKGVLQRRISATMNPLKHTPALAPPRGVTPNFVNPQSQALMVVVTSSICLILIIIISSLRFYTNLWIKKSVKADDSKVFPFSSQRNGRLNKDSCVCVCCRKFAAPGYMSALVDTLSARQGPLRTRRLYYHVCSWMTIFALFALFLKALMVE